MSDVVRCDLDGCPSTTVDDEVGDWLHLERRSDAIWRARSPGPWDFCSWGHLAEFSRRLGVGNA